MGCRVMQAAARDDSSRAPGCAASGMNDEFQRKNCKLDHVRSDLADSIDQRNGLPISFGRYGAAISNVERQNERSRTHSLPIPLDGITAKGNGINTSSHYGALTKAFQAENRLLAFTEPRPLAKLQPGCAAKAAVLLLYFVALVDVSPIRVGP